jgi:SSS family solute:Na+ symporter
VNPVLSATVVLVYLVALVFVALRARVARDFDEFSVARRALPLALIFGSIAATYVGPAFSISFVGRGFHSGFLFLFVGSAYAVQNILVGLLVAPRLRELKGCCTLGDAIGQKYGRKAQIIAGLISLGICTGFSAVMIKAGSVVLTDTLRLPFWLSVLLVAAITASYTTFGGLRASVITDAFHFALFAILLPVTLLCAMFFHFKGGPAAFAAEAPLATLNGLRSTPAIEIVGLTVAFLLGETLIPPYANLALASRTSKVSKNGFIIAGIFSILWFAVMTATGIMARCIVPSDTPEDHVLIELIRTLMPVGAYSLLLVALISIVLSSLDSLLNAGAVVFTEDIIKPLTALSDRTALLVGRRATIVIATVAAVCVPAVPSIMGGLLICYTVWASAILPAAIIGLWLKNPRPLAGVLSMGVGTLVAIIAIAIVSTPDFETKTRVTIIPALGAALAAYLIGHRFGKIKAGA